MLYQSVPWPSFFTREMIPQGDDSPGGRFSREMISQGDDSPGPRGTIPQGNDSPGVSFPMGMIPLGDDSPGEKPPWAELSRTRLLVPSGRRFESTAPPTFGALVPDPGPHFCILHMALRVLAVLENTSQSISRHERTKLIPLMIYL